MMPQHRAVSSDQFAGSVRQLFPLLVQVSVDETLVIAAGDKANLLRVRLFRQRQMMLTSQFAHLRLLHVSQRKQRTTELLLRESEEKIGLVLRRISGASQQPAIARRGKLAACMVPGCQLVR